MPRRAVVVAAGPRAYGLRFRRHLYLLHRDADLRLHLLVQRLHVADGGLQREGGRVRQLAEPGLVRLQLVHLQVLHRRAVVQHLQLGRHVVEARCLCGYL